MGIKREGGERKRRGKNEREGGKGPERWGFGYLIFVENFEKVVYGEHI